MNDLLVSLVAARPRDVAPKSPAVLIKTPSLFEQRVLAQRQRRADILAAARSLFDEDGLNNVTIRALTARSGSTAPTIYKLVGSRDVVLEEALLEMLTICIERAPVFTQAKKINCILGFTETLWLATRLQPSFSRHQIKLNWKTEGSRRLAVLFREQCTTALTNWLDKPCIAERLHGIAGPQRVAAALETHLRNSVIDWAEGYVNISRLRYLMAEGIAIILWGLVDKAEQARMTDWLNALEAQPSVTDESRPGVILGYS